MAGRPSGSVRSYIKRPGTTAVEGHLYEQKLCMCIVQNCVENNIAFELRNNVNGVDNFDDIVCTLNTNNPVQEEYFFLQAKHLTGSSATLFPAERNCKIKSIFRNFAYNVTRWFQAYVKVKNQYLKSVGGVGKYFETIVFSTANIESDLIPYFEVGQSKFENLIVSSTSPNVTNVSGTQNHVRKIHAAKYSDIVSLIRRDLNINLNMREFQEFCSAFRIYVNQPKQCDLDRIIINGIDAPRIEKLPIYNETCKQIEKWYVTQHSAPVLSQDIFKLARKRVGLDLFKDLISLENTTRDFNFKDNVVERYREIILHDQNSRLLITYNTNGEIFIDLLKQCLTENIRHNDYICMNALKFADHKKKVKHLIAGLCPPRFLILICDENTKDKLFSMWSEFFNTIKNLPIERVILCIKESSKQFVQNMFQICKIQKHDLGFNSLNTSSQNQILNTTIHYLGKQIHFRKLNVDFTKLITENILMNIKRGIEIKIGKPLLPPNANDQNNVYIERQVRTNSTIRDVQSFLQNQEKADRYLIFDPNYSIVFRSEERVTLKIAGEQNKLVESKRISQPRRLLEHETIQPSNVEKAEQSITRKIKIQSSNTKLNFHNVEIFHTHTAIKNRLSEISRVDQVQKFSYVHLLVYSGKFLRLINTQKLQSNTTISEVNKFLDVKNHQVYTEQSFVANYIQDEVATKMILLSSPAGMGKTVFAKNIAQSTLDCKQMYWPLYINLLDHSQYFKEHLKRNITTTKALDFLKSLVGLENSELFSLYCTEFHKVVLFIDGFDEISPQYSNVVNSLISELNNLALHKILLFTRPHACKHFQDRSQYINMHLEPFTEGDILSFFSKYFEKSITSEKEKARLDNFIEMLVHSTSNLNTSMWSEIASIPLITYMIANIFHLEMEQYVNSELDSHLKEPVNLAELNEKFLDEKVGLYLQGKQKCDDIFLQEQRQVMLDQMMKSHVPLALISVFGDELAYEIFETDLHCKDRFEESVLRYGIVLSNLKSNIQFIHRSFAEYFCACHILKIIMRGEAGSKFSHFILNCLLISDEFGLIRKFLNELISVEKRNPEKTFYNSIEITQMQEIGQICLERQTIGHVCSKEGNQHIFHWISSLLDGYEETKKIVMLARDTFGKTPLHYAAEKSTEISRFLINNEPNEVNAVCNYGKSALHYASAHGTKETVKLLLECKADLEISDVDGNTPFLVSTHNSDAHEIIQLLVMSGSKIDAQNNRHQNILSILIESGNKNMLSLTRDIVGIDPSQLYVKDGAGNTLLHYACTFACFSTVSYVIQHGFDVNVRNENGDAPLHCAILNVQDMRNKYTDDCFTKSSKRMRRLVETMQCKILKLLLDHNADIEAKSSYGLTPLALAVQVAPKRSAKYLVKRKANINTTDNEGWTILHIAVWHDRLELLSWIVQELKLDVTSKTYTNNTPLHCVSTNSFTKARKIIDVLLKCGANIEALDQFESTPLLNSLARGDYFVSKYLVQKGANICARDRSGQSCLHYAVYSNQIGSVELILDAFTEVTTKATDSKQISALDEDIGNEEEAQPVVTYLNLFEARDSDGSTPLLTAVALGNLAIAQYLVQRGANIEARDNRRSTILHHAVSSGKIDVVNWVLDHLHVDVNTVNKYGMTPLHSLTSKDEKESEQIIDKLLQCGANIEARNIVQVTPLMSAVFRCHLKSAKVLVGRGANVNIKTEEGMNLLHVAALCGNTDIAHWIIDEIHIDGNSRDIDGNTALHLFSQNTNSENDLQIIIRKIIQHGADIEAKNNFGHTPLLSALLNGFILNAKCLIRSGANHKAVTSNAETGLHLAVYSGNIEVIEWLLDNFKFNVNASNSRGETALHHVSHNVSPEFDEIIRCLIRNGANIESQNLEGNTPLWSAVGLGEILIAKYLLVQGAHFTVRNAINNDLGTTESSQNKIEVNAENNGGANLLHVAVSSGSLEMVKWVVDDLGVDLHSVAKDGSRPLHFVETLPEVKAIPIIKYLIGKGADLEAKNNNGVTILTTAFFQGKLSVAKYILEIGGDKFTTFLKGFNILHAAVYSGKTESVQWAVEELNIEVDSRSDDGATPLMCIAHSVNKFTTEKITEYLLKRGADIEAKCNEGHTALSEAILYGKLDVAKILIQKKADVNTTNIKGDSLLHCAVSYPDLATQKDIDVVKWVVEELGFDIKVENNEGKSALDLAKAIETDESNEDKSKFKQEVLNYLQSFFNVDAD